MGFRLAKIIPFNSPKWDLRESGLSIARSNLGCGIGIIYFAVRQIEYLISKIFLKIQKYGIVIFRKLLLFCEISCPFFAYELYSKAMVWFFQRDFPRFDGVQQRGVLVPTLSCIFSLALFFI